MFVYGCPKKTLGPQHLGLVKRALELGYTHLDLAWCFPKHRNLSTLFTEIKREEYKVIMKCMMGHDLKAAVENYGGFVDILLLHYPGILTPGIAPTDPKHAEKRHEYYREIEGYHKLGSIGEIGVSNFNALHLEKLV